MLSESFRAVNSLGFANFILKSLLTPQIRNFHASSTLKAQEYTDWPMVKDVKRRKLVKEYAFERANLQLINRNAILPREIQDAASDDLRAQPINASIVKLRRRCVVTSRKRGVLKRWRLSRIVWRAQVDYNLMSGIQRAMW